jgi:hypothetical protein
MQQQAAFIQEVSSINESITNSVLDGINESSEIIPNFVLSLTPLSNNVCCYTGGTGITGTCVIPVGPDPVNPQTCTAKMVLSYKIFSRWQEVIMSNNYMSFDITPYVINFLQKANSQQLFAQWSINRLNFTDSTQIFGDLLFEYGLPITIQIPESYSQAAHKLIADPRFNSIYN